ncbi:fimbrial protein [Klebsiella michiganensis]|nr:fimbrial protein [Klebsiella michiganensis]HED1871465.1 fimbrial protein [Klebsiella michiganensis]
MKLFTRLFLILGITLTGWSSVAWGDTGWCTPTGGTQSFSYNFGTKTITDSSQNATGTSFPDAFSWDLGQMYHATCACGEDGSIKGFGEYFTSQTSLPVGHNDGEQQYYSVNDYLEVAASVYMAGKVNQYLPLPWNAVPDGVYEPCSDWEAGTLDVSTGSKGKLSLYIKKAFVGSVEIPSTNIVNIYASVALDSEQPTFGGMPYASVYISGQVIVPQTCSVNAGQIVTVDFGSFMSAEFKNKGQMPTGYTPKTITVPIKCNGMDANASLTLRFQAEASADEPSAIKTSNDDVGVQITDDSGKVIEPNSGLLPFQLDDNLQATVTFHAAPISTTGNAPAEGTFSATAYIRVDFA